MSLIKYGTYYFGYPKRDPNFDNHPRVGRDPSFGCRGGFWLSRLGFLAPGIGAKAYVMDESFGLKVKGLWVAPKLIQVSSSQMRGRLAAPAGRAHSVLRLIRT